MCYKKSVCVTRKVNVDSNQLGGFSLEKNANDVYYLQNGFYRFNGSEKLRGLGKLDSKEMDTIERDWRLYYKYLLWRTKKLTSAIISNQIDSIVVLKEEQEKLV